MNTNCGLTLEELTASAICLGDYIRVPVTPHARLGMRNSSYDLDCGPPCDIANGGKANFWNLLRVDESLPTEERVARGLGAVKSTGAVTVPIASDYHARLGMRNSSYDLDCGPPCDIARGQTAGDHNLLGDTKAHIEIGRAILDASGISTGFRKDTSVGYVLEKSVLGMGSKNVAAPVTPERVRDAMSHS